MNSIIGKVTLKESGVGISDLLVVIYDLDPNNRGNDEGLETIGDRIGSVITGSDGSWSLSYDDSEFRVLNENEKRPDLQLMVLAPEDAGTGKPPVTLFSSKLLRVNSGRTESYLIRLTEKQLTEAEIAVPQKEVGKGTVENKIDTYRAAKEEQRTLRVGIRTVNDEVGIEDTRRVDDLGKVFRSSILPFDLRTNRVEIPVHTVNKVNLELHVNIELAHLLRFYPTYKLRHEVLAEINEAADRLSEFRAKAIAVLDDLEEAAKRESFVPVIRKESHLHINWLARFQMGKTTYHDLAEEHRAAMRVVDPTYNPADPLRTVRGWVSKTRRLIGLSKRKDLSRPGRRKQP